MKRRKNKQDELSDMEGFLIAFAAALAFVAFVGGWQHWSAGRSTSDAAMRDFPAFAVERPDR